MDIEGRVEVPEHEGREAFNSGAAPLPDDSNASIVKVSTFWFAPDFTAVVWTFKKLSNKLVRFALISEANEEDPVSNSIVCCDEVESTKEPITLEPVGHVNTIC
jgi:hypothetical protein